MEYIIAIDQSTSGTKALFVDTAGSIVSRADKAHEQKISPQGWVAHDPEEIYRNTLAVARTVIEKSGIDPRAIRGVGISNQRETALVWDRVSGKPVYDAVVWQCNRGEAICQALAPHAGEIQTRTGLRLSPYFSAAKIAWVLDHIKDSNTHALCAGTIDSWLIYKLTGNFKTDFSNASRTQLFNITSLSWDREICALFGIDPDMLAEVCDSNSNFGLTDLEGLLPRPVPIHSALGDSHAALFGQHCLKPGMGKVTYGTGSSVMINTGEKPVFCNDLSSSLAWGIDGKISYVLEGNINYSGAVIKWLVDELGLIASSKEAGKLAALANPQDTSYLVPAFSGLGAPHWKPVAKACLCGMTRATGKAEIVKAAEESIAYQIADIINIARPALGVTELRADGGAARDKYLMQFQSDILDMPVSVSEYEELSALGVAYLAGIALGIYAPSLPGTIHRSKYVPAMDAAERKRRYQGWLAAVRMVT
ncbi:MAG: glycerol kinase GlpK [Treponema sp.]|jgi:glycerol kinase|nr:glycerol kinase GlpK [Treponema sp.]